VVLAKSWTAKSFLRIRGRLDRGGKEEESMIRNPKHLVQ